MKPVLPAAAVSAAASAVFAYEAAALQSRGKLPTITALCAERPWLSAITVAALVVHYITWPKPGDPRPAQAGCPQAHGRTGAGESAGI